MLLFEYHGLICVIFVVVFAHSNNIPIVRKPNNKPAPAQQQIHHVAQSNSGGEGRRSTQLICKNDELSYNISSRITARIGQIAKKGFVPSCPCSYDIHGKCHQAPHQCVASNMTYHCTFKLTNFIISKEGGLFEQDTLQQVTFSDRSMAGGFKPNYHEAIYTDWAQAVGKLKQQYRPVPNPPHYDLVVAARMRWDDCFNHLSFQTMPYIGSVLEFHGHMWDKLHWHASLFTASMLNLLDIPMERIIVEKTIVAKHVFLPWLPHWTPVQVSHIRGIAGNLTRIMTKNLIEKKLTLPEGEKPLEPFHITIPGQKDSTDPVAYLEKLQKENPKIRYVAYMSRMKGQARGVVNEQELFNTIVASLNSDNYRLVVLGHSVEYKSVVKLQMSWQRYARVLDKAIVFMGPHGGGWNNLMFTPADVHYIEFNYQPGSVIDYVEGTARIRDVFLTAAFAKGGPGKYYTIEPNNKTVSDKPNMYYESYMRVSPRDVILAMQQIDLDVPALKLIKKDVKLPGWRV